MDTIKRVGKRKRNWVSLARSVSKGWSAEGFSSRPACLSPRGFRPSAESSVETGTRISTWVWAEWLYDSPRAWQAWPGGILPVVLLACASDVGLPGSFGRESKPESVRDLP